MPQNPYHPPDDVRDAAQSEPQSMSTGRAAYNVVTDSVTGVNVRWSDNRFQAVFVFVSVLLLSLVGAVLAVLNAGWDLPWYGGALIGSFAGLVVGIFSSGVFLMFYRAARHIKGQHD